MAVGQRALCMTRASSLASHPAPSPLPALPSPSLPPRTFSTSAPPTKLTRFLSVFLSSFLPSSPPSQDPELLRFVDLECFLWSTVSADLTPLINAGMVFCDRHFGGINYPVGWWAGGEVCVCVCV